MSEINQRKYRILVFSWNTESVVLGETLDPLEAEFNRSGNFTTWIYPCIIPDFFPNFMKFITEQQPDLIVIGFQEDRLPGSYFHSHLLPIEMPKIGYSLVKRSRLMGIGITSYKGLLSGDLFARGIRLSIYAKHGLASQIIHEEYQLRSKIGNQGQAEYICSSSLTRGKGAIASYIILPNCRPLALICCHLPFNSESLIKEKEYQNRMLRQNEVNKVNVCFNSIIENLVVLQDPTPAHIIYFGDFNYRLSSEIPASTIAHDLLTHQDDPKFIHHLYSTHDELIDQMRRGNIYKFKEGIDNSGPTFLPTCKMLKDSDSDGKREGWKTGKYEQRIPSWCDRILYGELTETTRNLNCVYYDRYDIGTVMGQSDHAGVMGIFELS